MTDKIKIDAFDRFMAVSHFDDEMAEAHTPTEDAIHNWIVDHQEDDELIAGILKHLDCTIKDAMAYCIMKAFKSDYINVRGCGRGAMIDNATGFSWVKEYFISDEVEIGSVFGRMIAGSKKPTKNPKKKSQTKKKTSKVETKSVVGKTTTGSKEPTKKPKKKQPKKTPKTKKMPKEVGKQLDLFSDLSVEEGEF